LAWSSYEPGEELRFLHPLPIESLWGVGPATAARLRRLGVTTVGELAAISQAALEAAVGRSHGGHLARLARGEDDRSVEPDREIKSVSHEETYPVDLYDRGELHQEVVRMADAVATRMRRAGVVGRTVTLKVRYGDFVTRTRSRTGPSGLSEGPSIAALALGLLDDVEVSPGVRLLGVGVSNLTGTVAVAFEQMSLDLEVGVEPGGSPRAGGPVGGTPSRLWREASGAVEAVRQRFGDGAVGPATLLGPTGLRVKRPGDTQWGPSGTPSPSDGPSA
jgi:DNA polymerase-4